MHLYVSPTGHGSQHDVSKHYLRINCYLQYCNANLFTLLIDIVSILFSKQCDAIQVWIIADLEILSKCFYIQWVIIFVTFTTLIDDAWIPNGPNGCLINTVYIQKWQRIEFTMHSLLYIDTPHTLPVYGVFFVLWNFKTLSANWSLGTAGL
jgi:hypothetical protein